MGIHYDYKSKRGERAMLKEAKRKERLALKKAKRASTIPAKEPEQEMHDINKPITLDDLTNPINSPRLILMINNQKDLKKERLSEALRENLKKRKDFLKKIKERKA